MLEGAHRVSPALRGDGREDPRRDSRQPAFPPRYAGMEGYHAHRRDGWPSFPRATRGWKGVWVAATATAIVSPALRGDGRISSTRQLDAIVFPPRYAGMEGHR